MSIHEEMWKKFAAQNFGLTNNDYAIQGKITLGEIEVNLWKRHAHLRLIINAYEMFHAHPRRNVEIVWVTRFSSFH